MSIYLIAPKEMWSNVTERYINSISHLSSLNRAQAHLIKINQIAINLKREAKGVLLANRHQAASETDQIALKVISERSIQSQYLIPNLELT